MKLNIVITSIVLISTTSVGFAFPAQATRTVAVAQLQATAAAPLEASHQPVQNILEARHPQSTFKFAFYVP